MTDHSMSRAHQWVIDQIDQGWVKLCAQDRDHLEISLPIEFLPSDIKEGQVLSLHMAVDFQATEKALANVSEQIQALSAEDDGGDFDL